MTENIIQITEEKRKRIIELALLNFSESFDVKFINAWRPSYLNEGNFLFKLKLEQGNKLWQWQFFYGDKLCERWFYNKEKYEGEMVISQGSNTFLPKPALNLNENNAADYFLDLSRTVLYPAVPVESFDLLKVYSQGSYQSDEDEDIDTINFYSHLMKEEQEKIAQALKEYPFCEVNRDALSISYQICVLEGDSLSVRTCRIFTEDKPSSFGSNDSKQTGHVEETGSIQILFAGLPDNYSRANEFYPYVSFLSAPKDIRGWQDVPSYEQNNIIKDINRNLAPLIQRVINFKRKYLSFYDLDFLHLTAEIKGNEESIYFLWKPGTVIALDGTSNPVHALNESFNDEKNGVYLLNSEDDAREYIRFFCDVVYGEDGPFTIIENKNDEIFKELNPEHLDLKDNLELEELLSGIKPLSIEIKTDDDRKYYHASGFVNYDTVLFKTTFEVIRKGDIDMIDDEPLALCEDWEILRLPYRFKRINENYFLNKLQIVDADSLNDVINDGVLESCLIIGQLNFEKLTVHTIKNCRFRGMVDMCGISSDQGLTIKNSIFERGIDIDSACFGDALSIYNVMVLAGKNGETAFSMERLTCDELIIDNLIVDGNYSLYGITTRRFYINSITVLGDVDLRYGLIEQYVFIENLMTTGDFDLYGTVIKQNHLSVQGNILVQGDLTASSVRTGTVFKIGSFEKTAVIKGSIFLNNAEIPKILLIYNTEVKGSLECRYLSAGAVRIMGDGIESPDAEPAESEESENQSPFMIGGHIDFSYAKIVNDILLLNLETRENYEKQQGPSLRLPCVEIGGDLRLFATKDWLRSQTFKPSGEGFFWVVLPHGIDLSQARIGGVLDISGVQCQQGGINLNDADLLHDLMITPISAHPAKALWMSMDSSGCRGTVLLTGLELTLPDSPEEIPFQYGLSARYSTISRGLITISISENMNETAAGIIGLLDLTGSDVNELVISKKSFPLQFHRKDKGVGNTQRKELIAGITLNHSIITRLTCIIIDGHYPRFLDFRYAEIKWWNFQDLRGIHGGVSQDFFKLLQGDPFLQQHTFRSIEKNLIDQGKEDVADDIHKQMRKWIRKQPRTPGTNSVDDALSIVPHLIKKSFLWLWDTLTGSTTTPFRLLTVVFIWFCLSIAFFSISENIIPSGQAIIASQGKLKADKNPDIKEWKALAPFWIALRYHVPVATFTAQDDWQPSGQKELIIWKTKARIVRSPVISAEDYANIVLIFHWLLWPMILILGSRKFFRNFEK